MELGYQEILENVESTQVYRGTVVPPNRLDTTNGELVAALCSTFSRQTLEELRGALSEFTGCNHIYFAPSARCAIARVLAAVPHRTVVMPAYTCPVVKTAVEVAGKDIMYVDIQRTSLNSRASEFHRHAKEGRVLIPTHLFGIPTDIDEICQVARQNGCLTIEDAAAAFGTSWKGRTLGTFGDVGIYSFERSKRLPAFRGAVILINNPSAIHSAKFVTDPIVATQRRLPLRELAFALGFNVATQPWLYGRYTLPRLLRKYAVALASRVPDCEDPRGTAFYTREFHSLQATLVLRMLRRLAELRGHVARLAAVYRDTFRGTAVESFTSCGDSDAGLLRFPVVVRGRRRSDVLREALRRGLYLETNYERPLPDESKWGEFPNSLWAAENVILLPLYRSLALEHARTLAATLVKVVEATRESGECMSGQHIRKEHDRVLESTSH